MPIYAYRCQSCGHSKDVLQKVSDPALVECPECHQPTFAKQLTAAGFHLKGTGWYVTDFKNPQKPAAKPADSSASSGSSSTDSTASSGSTATSGSTGSGEKAA
jgi:putative FmdB family regulatory protein